MTTAPPSLGSSASVTALRIDLVFPRFKLLSGAERAILGLGGALGAAGHDVRIVCHQFDESCRPRVPPGVDVACTDARLDWTNNRYVNAVSDYGRALSLRHALDPRASVYVLFGPSLPLAWQLSRRGPDRAPVLYYCWEPPRALYQDRELVLERLGWRRLVLAPMLRAYAGLDRALVRHADRVCTSSPFAASQVEAAYERPATVITLGIDRDRLDRAYTEKRSGPPRVLTVNYLHPRKRVDLFIAAAAEPQAWEAPGERPRWVVVGDGPERVRLEALSRELGVADQVEFTGFVPDDDLPKYYAAASCYVHTGLEESFGLSVIEAAYCGCPVVAVDEGGVRQTIADGVTGHLVPPTAQDLARSVRSVLSQADGGRSMGAAAHDRISRAYRWEQGAADIVDLAQAVSLSVAS